MKRITLTYEQLKALETYSATHGRNWKADLRLCWMTGDYGLDSGYSDKLQQIRNIFGPNWLTRFSFNKTISYSRSAQ